MAEGIRGADPLPSPTARTLTLRLALGQSERVWTQPVIACR